MPLFISEVKEVLWSRWCETADKYPDKDAIVHWVTGEEPFRWSFSELIQKSEFYAAVLMEKGIKKGEVCAIIMRHNKELYPIYLACIRAGALPAILAYPNPRLHPDKFRQGLEGMSQRSGLDWILTEKELDGKLRPLIEKDGSTVKGIHFPLQWEGEPVNYLILNSFDPLNALPNDPVMLQHSSGTTGLQKPIVLTHRHILNHTKNYSKALHLKPEDKIISWLPLYHDMGLIAAFYMPLLTGTSVVQLDTFEWVIAPAIMLDAISKERGTMSWIPNFAFNIMADKIHDEELEGISLDTLRMLINASEPVRYEGMDKFYERFRKYGLKRESLSSLYGMAEVTLACTQTRPGREPEILFTDRNELSNNRVVFANKNNGHNPVRICVSSGKVIDGCKIKIVDEKGNNLPELSIGEIIVSSEAMFDGYRNYPEKTAEVLKNGWYYSGDYGFIYHEECYVIGRKKDIIIVGGNNIFPEDIEDIINGVNGVIPGRVIAFGEYNEELGSEQVSIIAETAVKPGPEHKKMRMEIIMAGMQIDVSIKKIYLVPPRWLIKSSAGKPSRKANRERIKEAADVIWE